MIFQIEIPDADLEYLVRERSVSRGFTMRRNCGRDDDSFRNLLDKGIIEQVRYDGEELQYTLRYNLTKVGELVMTQYLEEKA